MVIIGILVGVSGCFNFSTETAFVASGPVGRSLNKEDVLYYVFLSNYSLGILGKVTEIENYFSGIFLYKNIERDLGPKFKELEGYLNDLDEIKPPEKFKQGAKSLRESITLFRRQIALYREGSEIQSIAPIEEALQISYTAGYYLGKALSEMGEVIQSKLI